MTNNNRIRTYKKPFPYTYTIGAYPTIELLKTYPNVVDKVFVHSKYEDLLELNRVCNEIPLIRDDAVFPRLGLPDNSYVLGIFQKYEMQINRQKPHVVLVNPSDMGNLGTIIRTMLGFGFQDIAVITPAADIWNPKTIRASMGAFFHIRIQCFPSFFDYQSQFANRPLYPFMLEGKQVLSFDTCPKSSIFSLIFGNEAAGLDSSFQSVGEAIRIPQTGKIDSLNLAAAAAVGMYTFALRNKLI